MKHSAHFIRAHQREKERLSKKLEALNEKHRALDAQKQLVIDAISDIDAKLAEAQGGEEEKAA